MNHRLLAALLLALVACDQTTIGPTLPTVDANWRVIRPGMWQPELTSVVAFTANDLYASHSGVECDGDACGVSASQLLHYDGSEWEEVEFPPDAGWVNHLWARESNDLYICGRSSTLYHYNGTSWTLEPIRAWNLAGTSTQFFAAYRDTLYEKTPAGWDTLRAFDERIERISAAEDGSLLVSTYLEALFWNGAEWRTLIQHQYGLGDIVCISATDAFVLDRSAGGWNVMHWDGAQLSMTFTIPDRYVYSYDELAFAGRAPTQLFIVGSAGSVYAFDGFDWSQVPRGTAFDLIAGSVADTGELVAVGGQGKVMSFDGAQWTTLREAAPRYVEDFWAESDSRLMIASYPSAFIYDGTSLSETPPAPSNIGRLAGYSMDDIYATSGNDVFHFDGTEWSIDADSLPTYLYDIATAPGGTVYAVGEGAVYRRVGSWERIYEGTIGFGRICATSSRAVAVGAHPNAQTGFVGEFDGTTWRMRPIQDYPFDAVITSDSKVLVAGFAGIYREDGNSFVAIPSLASMRSVRRIFELSPNRFIAYADEQFAYFDGTLWLLQPIETRLRTEQALSRDILGAWDGGAIVKWEFAQ